MLAGQTDDLPADLTGLSTTGLLRDRTPRMIERWIETACAAGLLIVSSDRYRTLTLTACGREVMAGRIEDVRMVVPEEVVSATRRTRRGSRAPRARRRRLPRS
jgi:hypothetical protein